jgi:p-hydroxybenzoate 3-monooxygenase
VNHTKIAIIGAGPAGLFLGHLLSRIGIEVVVLEKRSRDHVEQRVRAGVLEQCTVDLMDELGVGERLHAEGLPHEGVNLAVDDSLHRIDFAALTGSTIMVYGQSEVMKDLGAAADARGMPIVYGAEAVEIHGVETSGPTVTWRAGSEKRRITCDFVVGADGFHGAARASIPADALEAFERVYPFGWLGVLADVPPCRDELVYANHVNGFALASMRSPTRSRYYVQVPLEDRIEDWPDERFWDEVSLRLGPEAGAHVMRAPSFEKSIAPLRSFVCETMRWGRMFLTGDAAHIVPPTGAKGLNLAVSDVIYLARALEEFYRTGSETGLAGYPARALARVWAAERFSWWFTTLTHRFPHMDAFDRKMQVAELQYLFKSRAAQAALAENYVGLPL